MLAYPCHTNWLQKNSKYNTVWILNSTDLTLLQKHFALFLFCSSWNPLWSSIFTKKVSYNCSCTINIMGVVSPAKQTNVRLCSLQKGLGLSTYITDSMNQKAHRCFFRSFFSNSLAICLIVWEPGCQKLNAKSHIHLKDPVQSFKAFFNPQNKMGLVELFFKFKSMSLLSTRAGGLAI